MLTRNFWTSAMFALWIGACGGGGANCPEGSVKKGDVCTAEDGKKSQDTDPSTISGDKKRDAGSDPESDGQVTDPERGAPCSGPLFKDADGDGFGDPAVSRDDCNITSGWVRDDTDCDDDNNQTHPQAPELCDRIDNDCNDIIDDDAKVAHYADCDRDGFAAKPQAQILCRGEVPPGSRCAWVEREPKDENSTDCNDGQFDIKPSAEEVCDDVDNNCRGGVDEENGVEGALKKVYYTDNDGDGWGAVAATTATCTQPAKTSPLSGDCNDNPAGGSAINPNALELCDYLDNNCRDGIDEGLQTVTWVADCDGDDHITTGAKQTRQGCAVAPSGGLSCGSIAGQKWLNVAASEGNDCDDTRKDTYVDAPEVCDEGGHDESCVLGANDKLKKVFYGDCDGDGWLSQEALSAQKPSTFCKTPSTPPVCGGKWVQSGAQASGVDCDDVNPRRHPGQEEQCDAENVDHDCNPATTDASLMIQWFVDCDGDGYLATPATPQNAFACPSNPSLPKITSCAGTLGTPRWQASPPWGDCADLDRDAHPNAFSGAGERGMDLPINGGSATGYAYDYNCVNGNELPTTIWPHCATLPSPTQNSPAKCWECPALALECGQACALRSLNYRTGSGYVYDLPEYGVECK